MNFKQIVGWFVGYQAVTWFLVWMNLRTPWVDKLDGSVRPTTNQVILLAHIYTGLFFATIIAFIFIFMRVWRASNRRR
jgi:hypothetical protein